MGLFISQFNTVAEYNAVKNSLTKPHVSYILETDGVGFIPSASTPSQHDYVDLGLPSGTKWATMNVGASSETDYGNYYQYGKGADDYSVTSGQSNYEGTETPLAASADTAVQVWGGQWHMPTSAQCQELIDNTVYTWEENFNGSGINGGKFTAQNGNYVFFPAAGYMASSSLYGAGSYGYCWSSNSYGYESYVGYESYFLSLSSNVNNVIEYNVMYAC